MDSSISRRTLVKGGLTAAAGLALPQLAGALGPDHEAVARWNKSAEGVMTSLATYMKDAQTRALPAEAAEHTRLHILDTFAAIVSGSALPPGKAALDFVRAYSGNAKTTTTGASTIVASKMRSGPIEAALANAVMAHADETDDSHAPSQSHPGCAIVPAALATCERFATDGARFMRSVALGYDVGTRMNMALHVSNFEVANHQSSHAFGGIWGASAAAGCAAGLSLTQLPWLVAYAADQSSGLTVWQRDTDHIQKAFAFAGVGARNGVTAALVVHAGWTGVDDVFTGQYNFFNTYGPNADLDVLVDKLGVRYEVVRTNIKKWTVGSPIQAPLDALEAMRAKHPFEASQVRKVVIRSATSEAKLVDNRDMPDICMQYMIAVMLLDKTATFASAHDKARMQAPDVQRERAKVTLIGDEELERLLPKRVAVVDVTLADGTTLTERVEAVRGTAQNPMTREEIVGKARDLMAPILGAAKTTRLIDKLMTLDTVPDVRELAPLLA
ncbi:MAG TPA: MmgE/PrpD family protein [Gemmatimonadaceae bacterium]|jgi:2-methylcitrate dehydratase PrpD